MGGVRAGGGAGWGPVYPGTCHGPLMETTPQYVSGLRAGDSLADGGGLQASSGFKRRKVNTEIRQLRSACNENS